jgi:CDP-6-deoxy-D-xylo-4-hexulose-3-dehydrase
MKNFKWPLMKDNITLSDRLCLSSFSLFSKKYTNGEKVRKFEKKWNDWLGSKYSLYVSSGSTANYLLLAAVKEMYNLNDGDKVLVPSCTWATNIGPVIQLGFTPIFCDINLDNFSFCEQDLEYIAKIHPDIKLIFVTHLIGFSANNERYKNLFPNALILDDVCESHGCKSSDGSKRGSDSLGATFSFYFGHHISTIEGGMISTNNYELYDLMKMKRSHGLARESTRYAEYVKQYPDISNQFLFITDGYNFRNHEICAVLGLSQLERLDKYIQIRNRNYIKFIELIKQYSDMFIVPKYYTTCSNFCFPLICKTKKIANELKKEFDRIGIEHRPIISGNLLRQPFLKDYTITTNKESLTVDFLHNNGIYLGNNQFIGTKELKLLESVFVQNSGKYDIILDNWKKI